MLTIRLQRKGKKNQPFFKIVVTEAKRSSTRGRFVEELGFYNPLTKERKLKGDRAKYWMSVGAQPSDTVYNMLVTDNIIEGKKRPKHKKSKKKQEESAPAAAAETTKTSEAKPTSAEPVKTEETTPEQGSDSELAKTEETTKAPKEVKTPQEQSQEAPAEEPAKTEEAAPEEPKEKTHNP